MASKEDQNNEDPLTTELAHQISDRVQFSIDDYSDSPKEIASHEPIEDKLKSDDVPHTLRSREPVEDEYHGDVAMDYRGVFTTSGRTDDSSFHHSLTSGIDVQSEKGLRSFQPDDEMTRAIHRINSLEAKMEIQERVNEMTQHELVDVKDQIRELEENPVTKEMEEQLHILKSKTEKYLSKLEKEKDDLQTENKQLQETMVKMAVEQADSERSRLLEFDKKYEEKLAELKRELENTCEKLDKAKNERDEARVQRSISESEKEVLRRDRDDWRRKRTESESQKENLAERLQEKEKTLEKKEKILQKFGERFEAVSKENRRLRRENSYLRETIFRVVRVGAVVASDMNDRAPEDVEFECFSCHMTYKPSAATNPHGGCRFHPLPAMHFREWSRWPITKTAGDESKLYWPCCEKLSYNRPPGCCVGRHHQSWEMDIVMKNVLLSKDNLDWDT